MKLGMKELGGIIGAAALTVTGLGLLGSSGCGDDLKNAACTDFTCADKGVAEGNFAISGYAAIDSFFKSVVDFKKVAGSVSADIRAELKEIQLAFGISDAEIQAEGSLGAALEAKLQADFNASIKVEAQPAQCKVDASLTATVTAECQASAGCDVDPGKASLTCMGKCTAEVSAAADCDAKATVVCELSGPQVECTGECSGSCTVDVSAGGSCEGTCKGTCEGECMGSTDSGGNCNGQCMGMCKGSCELTGMAALDCKGTCNGTCKATPPSGECDANAKVSCEFEANAEVACKGSCDGEFIPPKVECEASASCEASAKADAKFNATCTPPSVDVKVVVNGSLNADAQAQLDFAIGKLKARLPELLAKLKKAELVVDAGAELTSAGKAAIEGTLDGLADGDLDIAAAFKIGKCVPAQLNAAGKVVADAGKGLKAEVEAAASVTAALGM